MDQQESITGRLVRVRNRNSHGFIYKADDSDFVIGKMKVDDQHQECTIRGKIYKPTFDADYVLHGNWEDTRYGRKFSFTSCSLMLPADEESICRYLVNHAHGIGETLAKKIYETFGSESLFILKNDPQKAAMAISGLTEEAADNISKSLSAIEDREKATSVLYGLLGQFGVAKKRVGRIVEELGPQADQIVRDHPYALVEVTGIGFMVADRLWLKLNKEPGSLVRQCAAAYYCIEQEITRSGSVWILKDKIMDSAASRCGVEVADESLDLLVEKGYRAVFPDAKSNRGVKCLQEGSAVARYSTTELWQSEIDVAARISEMSVNRSESVVEMDGFDDEDQRQAIQTIFENQVSILTGPAGSGKTTLAAQVLASMQDKRVAACAPTGKAARRLSQLFQEIDLPLAATTVHRLLEPKMEGGRFVFSKNAANTIDADVVLVDELSMVDSRLLADFMRAIDPVKTKVIFSGDESQLPPVGPGSPLMDMCAGGVHHTGLTKVRRAGGQILTAANMIRRGKYPEPCAATDLDNGDNWRHLECSSSREIKGKVSQLYDRLIEAYDYDPVWDVQTISPLNEKTEASCLPLNQLLQDKLNPCDKDDGNNFRVHDKVVYRKNCYLKGWYQKAHVLPGGRFERIATEHLVVNGDVGSVVAVTEHNLCVRFTDPTRYCQVSRLDPIHLSYCCTVHVSQGSEWPVVIMVVDSGANILLSRELLYTGMTRARDYLITVGQMSTLRKAIGRETIGTRQTNLTGAIHSAVEAIQEGFI